MLDQNLPDKMPLLGVLRVITRPEIDPTRSKETKIPDPYPTRKLEVALLPDPTRTRKFGA